MRRATSHPKRHRRLCADLESCHIVQKPQLYPAKRPSPSAACAMRAARFFIRLWPVRLATTLVWRRPLAESVAPKELSYSGPNSAQREGQAHRDMLVFLRQSKAERISRAVSQRVTHGQAYNPHTRTEV